MAADGVTRATAGSACCPSIWAEKSALGASSRPLESLRTERAPRCSTLYAFAASPELTRAHSRRPRPVGHIRLDEEVALSALKTLQDMGQSIWLDSISRELLESGTPSPYAANLSVTGRTSNA